MLRVQKFIEAQRQQRASRDIRLTAAEAEILSRAARGRWVMRHEHDCLTSAIKKLQVIADGGGQ